MEFATKNPAEDGSAPATNALERIDKMNMTGITIIRTGCQAPWKEALRKAAITTLAAALVFIISATAATAASRIKDIVYVEGVRDNMLVGYGLVVGLNNTGDTLRDGQFTKESLQSMLNRLGVQTTDSGLDSDNVAAVMVTASLPAFARQGSRIDVTVSALGDADSLLGGTLLVTPMLGADGEVYAVAQGQLAVGGFQAGGAAETVTKGVPTSGRIASGAIIEREVGYEFGKKETIKLSLRNPDFTTARRIAQAINAFLGTPAAAPSDPTTIVLRVPESYKNNVVDLLTDLEQLRVEPDQIARVVIDEQSGIIVMGDNVRISTVAIAQGSLTIRITEAEQVSQPGPFAEVGTTTTVQRTAIEIDEGEENRLTVLQPGVSLQEMVNGLNALGIGPRDMITILQAIKTAGALQAEIEVM